MTNRREGCASYQGLPGIDRRGVMKLGALAGLGVSLPELLRREAEGSVNREAKAKNVILLWLQGGVSHHDTFDPKPQAPEEIRGEFDTIATTVPGVRFGQHMQRTAQMLDTMTLIRSVTHSESDHYRGSMYMVEGRRPPRGAGGEVRSGNPTLGSIVAHELGIRGGLPPHVNIPGNCFTSKFVGHGWLPPTAAPFSGQQSPSLASGGISPDRFAQRASLRETLAHREAGRPIIEMHGDSDAFYQQAVEIIGSGRGAAAFDIDQEPDSIKALYGLDLPKNRNDKGRLCLTARRLIEAGVRFVTIGRNSWDHHATIFPQLASRLPTFDHAWAGLITDLKQRGLLDETLVVYLTEYGRTPRVNSQAGRDHWPQAFSVAFAGAGVPGGQVVGATDRDGAAVIDRPVTPEEIAATILHLVGIPPQKEYSKADGRPVQYVDYARPLSFLLG